MSNDRPGGMPEEPGRPASTVHVEFFVEPFAEGSPGPHVLAAVEAARAAGLSVELGPFASLATGPAATVADAVQRLVAAAFEAGATRVQLQVDRVEPGEP